MTARISKTAKLLRKRQRRLQTPEKRSYKTIEGGPANPDRPSRLVKLIRHTAKRLVGLPLTDTRAALNLQIFEFGEQKPALNRKGEEVTFGDYFLTLTCDWELSGPLGTITQYSDYRLPPQPTCILSPDHFLTRPFDNLRSQRACCWLWSKEDNLPVVRRVDVGNDGETIIRMSQGFVLRLTVENEEADGPWSDWSLRRTDTRKSVTVGFGQILRFDRT